MSKIKNSGLDQYGTEPSEKQQFGTAGIKGIKNHLTLLPYLYTTAHHCDPQQSSKPDS